MEEGLTPEEKLLKLIREGGKNNAQEKTAEQPARPQAEIPQPQTYTAQEKAATPTPVQTIKPPIKFTFEKINKALLAVFLIVFVYTVCDLGVFVIPHLMTMASKRYADLDSKEKPLPVGEESIFQKAAQPQPLTYYMQDIEKKNVFKSAIAEQTAAVNQTQEVKVKLDEMAKGLVLKGIVAGEAPEAVIEDTKSGKTYFLKQGEKIGDVSVEEITDTRVRIGFGEQSAELVL